MDLKRVQPQNIDSLVESFGWKGDKFLEKSVLNRLRSNWVDIIGPIYCNQACPTKFSNSTLWITVTHPAYKMELGFIQENIIQQVNKLFSRKVAHKIKFSVGQVATQHIVAEKKQGSLEGKENLLAIIDSEKDPEAKSRLIELIKKFNNTE